MSEQRSLSWGELAELQNFAENKYSYMDEETREQAIFEFVSGYIDGGKFTVFNSRNQFLADFDVLDDAIAYKDENEPKNEIWSIEVVKF